MNIILAYTLYLAISLNLKRFKIKFFTILYLEIKIFNQSHIKFYKYQLRKRIILLFKLIICNILLQFFLKSLIADTLQIY